MPDYNNITPDWVKNAVFYQIFPDRFAQSAMVQKPINIEPWDSAPSVHGFKGGDLMGVLEKLDYISDLGVNAIYFNPVFQSASNHRYHTHDYYQVDPLLGGNAAFRLLLDACHTRGIKVILDGVFNHASRGFFQFNHILETEAHSPYLNWFHVNKFPMNAYNGQPNYECWWNLPALPKFNTDNPQVRSFLFDVARYWVEFGIDGWRLDVPFEIDDDAFWREFRLVVKSANPDAYIFGEIPSEAQHWMAGDQFDAVMNYQITHACLAFFGGPQVDHKLARGMMGLPPVQDLDAPAFGRRSEALLLLYPRQFSYAQMNLLDSHDMPRFLSLVSGNVQRLYLAYLFLLTYPGAPSIYYGDEVGMSGGRDPDNRRSFNWAPGTWNLTLRDGLKELIQLRQAIPALRTGSYEVLYAQEKVLVYLREDENDKVLVVINADDRPAALELDLQGRMAEGAELQDQIGEAHLKVSDGRLVLPELSPLSALILA